MLESDSKGLDYYSAGRKEKNRAEWSVIGYEVDLTYLEQWLFLGILWPHTDALPSVIAYI